MGILTDIEGSSSIQRKKGSETENRESIESQTGLCSWAETVVLDSGIKFVILYIFYFLQFI